MADTTALEFKLQEMASRIRELREITGKTTAEMAEMTGVSEAEYIQCESGEVDLNFAFLYRCALALGVDVTDIIEGSSPTLSSITLTRAGEGRRIEQAHGMVYYNLAYLFKNRIAEPLYVQAIYSEEAQYKDIELTSHAGQECDIVIRGQLKVQVGEHSEILNEGDSIYYDSGTPHGMIAIGGQDCEFYAIVLNPTGQETEAREVEEVAEEPKEAPARKEPADRQIWEDYLAVTENETGTPVSLTVKPAADHFNFAFDVVDEIANRKPNKLAMLHVDKNKMERYFSFSDMSHYSSRAANYFKALGIRRGDRVLLVLKRHYQFWITMLGLEKLGAVAIPASNQMLAKDLEYRIHAAGITAVMCTQDDGVADQMELALQSCPEVQVKLTVGESREGWHNFDEEFRLYSSEYIRPAGEDCPCGDDLLLMFFTSGTSGYPKIAAHSHKYPLGHFMTARYWHCVDPDGLHLTISDTGWAKAMWGKMFGQWLCQAAVFVYDFDRFHAEDILPMFAKYNITTFCAPPTMYRMLIKEDLSKYDMSSIRHATIAGEALNPEVFHQFKKATGLSVMEGFGQSESPVMIGNLRGMTPKVGSMGKPVPGFAIDVVDTDGNSVEDGVVGEIVVRTDLEHAPCGLFRGYYNDPEKTDAAWHDGLYHTGDTAWRDEDGYLWYEGRVDDLIKSSGYRIGPFEIESVIMELPYVLECGVSAAPDPVRGQVVKASIVLVKGAEGSDELKKEIQNYVKSRTAPYKYPRIVVFKDELPKTTSGKIIRKQL